VSQTKGCDMVKVSKAAIELAKKRGADQVTADDLLMGSLSSISRFGISWIGPWAIDLELMGEVLPHGDEVKGQKVTYAPDAVSVFDKAAFLAKQEKSKVGLVHILVAFAYIDCPLMIRVMRTYGFTATEWRAELARNNHAAEGERAPEVTIEASERPLLNPEEAAGLLGVHTQTVRGYIRSGKLPAHRLAGERALRIRREDIFALLEPFSTEEVEGNQKRKGD
jgi:excisionase family DNA binding protein